MKRVLMLVLLSSLVFVGMALADGQETGLIVGKVTDASGSALPGVTITAEAGRGSQSQITDASGEYRFALLVPGDYTVIAELEGFQAGKKIAQVSGGGKAQVDFTLSMGTSETITVTSEAPMVDKFNVTAGATVTSEVGEQTAGTTRTYYGVINTLPGVASDPQNEDIQQTRPNVNGTSWAEQQVFIDGVDTSFARYGGSRVFLPTTAVTEVTMEAGGSSAEYGRAIGSTTNVIVKSGTNQFHGDFATQYQEVGWAAEYETQPALAERQDFPADPDFFKRSEIEEDNDSTGLEASVGGPLVRDKAWFFVGWSDVDTNDLDKTLNGDPVDASLNTEARIAKLNFQPGTSHQISASYIDTPASRVYFNPESNDYWTPTPHVIDGTLGTLTWNWSVNSDFFLESKIATQQSDENKLLACFSTNPDDCIAQKQQDRGPDGEGPLRFPGNPALGIHYPGNNYDVYRDSQNDGAWNNGWLLDNGFGTNEFPRDQANVALTQFAGSNHELKYGIDWQTVEWDANIQALDVYDGPFFNARHPFGFDGASSQIFLPNQCGLTRLDQNLLPVIDGAFGLPFGTTQQAVTCAWTELLTDRGLGSGNTKNEDLAFYLRDRFTVGDHWTFNLGFRFESTVAENDIGREVVDDQHVAPRLSATYDVKGDGQMLLSLNVGRYYAQLNQQWIQEHLRDQPNGEIGSDQRTWLFCDAVDAAFVPQCGGQVGYNFLLRTLRSGRMWELVDQGIFDSDIEPYYKDEIILGFEWQFSRNWAVDAKAMYWELDNMIGATIQSSPFGDQFKFVANYEDYPAILQQIDDVRVANGGPRLFSGDTLANFEEGKMEYQALQLQLNRRFADGWAWYNNITFSETETTGSGAWWNNTNSDYGEDLHVLLTQADIDECNDRQTRPSSRTGRIRTFPVDCSVLTPFIGQPVSTVNRFGNAGNIDRPVIFNSFGFKTWSIGAGHDVTVGGHLTFQSGLPWNRTESVSTIALDGNEAANASVTLFVEEPGERRLDDIYTLNLSFNWGFPLWSTWRGGLRVEGLNVTDQQDQVFTNSRGEVRPVRRDFQRPRQVRASFSIKF